MDFGRIPREHFDFIEATMFYYEETVVVVTEAGSEKKDFLFVHAGIAPGVPLEKQDRYDLLWIRDRFIDSESKYEGRIVVHGHTPENLPAKSHCRICVDSGVYQDFEKLPD